MVMKSNTNEPNKPDKSTDPGFLARTIVRRSLKAALATLDRTSGHPYASLVTVATSPGGAPLILISKLALHTQNILVDPRASLLFDASGTDGDPLAGGRVTLIGHLEQTQDQVLSRRFLARHPAAAGYAGFPDFAFYQLCVERAHFVGGFGRIVSLAASDLLIDLTQADELIAAEPDIISHMNEDHSAAVELYASALAGEAAGPWRMSGIDPEGCDLLCGGAAGRVSFASQVLTAGGARRELARLAAAAREVAVEGRSRSHPG